MGEFQHFLSFWAVHKSTTALNSPPHQGEREDGSLRAAEPSPRLQCIPRAGPQETAGPVPSREKSLKTRGCGPGAFQTAQLFQPQCSRFTRWQPAKHRKAPSRRRGDAAGVLVNIRRPANCSIKKLIDLLYHGDARPKITRMMGVGGGGSSSSPPATPPRGSGGKNVALRHL